MVKADTCRLQDEIWSRIASAVITRGFYDADCTGVRDATKVIQRAIDDAARRKGGVVYLPKGRYRLDGGLSLGASVSLVGERNEDGTPAAILLAYAGKGKTEGALLNGVGEETSIEGIGIFYPEQSPDAVLPYPPTIAGTLVKIRNTILYNSYHGLDANSPWGVNGAVIENLRGTVLSRGITATFSMEFGWMRDVDFSPHYWAEGPGGTPLSGRQLGKVKDYIKEHLIGLELGRIDGLAIYRFRADGAKTPVLIRENSKYQNGINGFGGVVAGFPKLRQEEGTGPWYYGMHYANLDNVPEIREASYTFALDRLPRRTDAAAFYNVAGPDFGAKGDGKSDDTAAIQKALKTAGEQGGGTVFLPNGEYKITAPLEVPSGVELRGTFGIGHTRDDHTRCRLSLYSGKNTDHPATAAAGITLQESAGIRGFSIFHPDQYFDPKTKTIVPYPFAIRGAGSGVWIVDVALVDAYQGIDFGLRRCDNFLVRGVWGTAFEQGLVVGGGSRGGCLERVAFTFALAFSHLDSDLPWDRIFTSRTAKLFQDHSTAYSFGHCSNVNTWGLVSFNSRIGMRFFDDGKGVPVALDLWQSMLDASTFSTLVAEAGSNIRCLGLFSSYNPKDDGKRTTNWLEVAPAFAGPLSVYAKTLIEPSLAHPYNFTSRQVAFFDEVSLTTANSLPSRQTVRAGDLSNVLDRNPRTFWRGRSGMWPQVDLGTIKKINRFAVELCPFVPEGLVADTKIELYYSLDGNSFQKAPTLKVRRTHDFPLENPVECRYVKLCIDGRDGDHVPVSRFDVFSVAQDMQDLSGR